MAAHMTWGIIEEGWRKGPWTAEEDRSLIEYVKLHGEGRWNSVALLQGLKRNGKSCRLRWVNYLRPDLKRGQITPYEETIIQELHARWGNRWSTIARSLPGRTDNEIKNYWRTHFKKKVKTPSDDAAKSNARMLKKQQFQQLLQQQQQQSYELEMKNVMPNLHDKNEHTRMPMPSLSHHQLILLNQQDYIANTYNHMHRTDHYDQEHCYSSTSMVKFNGYDAPMSESTSSNQELFWDGSLWNLDDFQGTFSAISAATRATLQSLATPLL